MSAERAYQELVRLSRERTVLGSCATLLEWDEDVCMPAGGAAGRAEQHALLARLLHELASAVELGELLAELDGSPLLANPASPVAINVRELRREHEDARLTPVSLVEDLARATSLSKEAWREARLQRSAAIFLPHLGRVVDLVSAQADCLARGRSRYDVVLDEWEPGLTWATLEPLLERVRDGMAPLRAQVLPEAGPPPTVLAAAVPASVQAAICRELAGWLGFDLDQGRLDEAVHPSTTRIAPGDVRLTTRYREHAFTASLFATLHEVGHGLYEQYLPEEHFGAPVGEAASLGMHEAQARLIENHVGRARGFWEFLWPRLRERMGGAFSGASADDLWLAVNHFGSGIERITADELGYDLHIAIRVELERALLTGDLPVRELPAAWNDAYQRTLGVRPTEDTAGCLQDGHWAEALFGYFPTYTLGNLIAAQLMERLRRDRPDFDRLLECGDFAPLNAFLRDAIHRHGSHFATLELVQRATGAPLSAEPQLRYLGEKVRALQEAHRPVMPRAGST